MNSTDNDPIINEVLNENNAQRVLHEMDAIRNQGSVLISRWVWELMQNARGAAQEENDLQIQVENKSDLLIFRHNGKPFSEKEITHLIYHGSTKSGQSEIGRFGTGFIATHLLSPVIEICGSTESGFPFQFELNRKGATATELRTAMEVSWSAFNSSLSDNIEMVHAPFTTEFRYPISSCNQKAIKAGIQSLKNAAPYIFAFNPMLKKLEIIQADTDSTVLFTASGTLGDPESDVGRMRVLCKGDTSINIYYSKDNEVVAAVAVQELPTGNTILLPSANSISRLFIAFPLTGMERFPLPIVLNSEKFISFPDRDGIPLSEGEDKQNLDNKKLLEVGFDQIVRLLAIASKNEWGGIPKSLEIIGTAHGRGSATDEWLKNMIRDKIIEGLRNCLLVTTIDKTWVEPAKSWIPMSSGNCDSNTIWSLASKLKSARSKLPNDKDSDAWGETIKQWRQFARSDEEEWPEFFDFWKFAQYVSEFKSLDNLSAEFDNHDEMIEWLRSFYDSISKSEDRNYFSRLEIVPDQHGNFQKSDKLSLDDSIQDDLKEIGNLHRIDYKRQLVHNQFRCHSAFENLRKMNEDQIIRELLDSHRKLFKDDEIRAELLPVNVNLFVALVRRRQFRKLEGFPVASFGETQEHRRKIVLSSRLDQNRRYLAPVPAWPETAKSYSDVFPEKVILATEYHDGVSTEVWDDLTKENMIHRDAIFFCTDSVNKFLPDEPLAEDERKMKSNSMVTLSNVAWGEGRNSIFDRSRNSHHRSLQLLKYFIEHALVADEYALDKLEISCDNGEDHRYYPANWLAPMRERRWVNVGSNVYDTPSVKSLTPLLKKSPELLKRLNDSQTFRFFKAINVSPSEIMLHNLSESDEDRMCFIQSITDIASAADNDPKKVQELVTALRNPKTRELINTQRLEREQVEQNQELGKLGEQVFKNVFDEHMTVLRSGHGHDYELSDLHQVDGGTVICQNTDQSVFVEIKSTSKLDVRMSILQAKNAVEKSNHYVLCVVPTDFGTINQSSFKENARFVFDIGVQLKLAWDSYSKVEEAHKNAYSMKDVQLEIGRQDNKFRVNKNVWENGVSFNEALLKLKNMMCDQWE